MRYLLFAAMALLIGCSGHPASTAPASTVISTRLGVVSFVMPKALQPDTEYKTYARDEFKKLVIGKTMDEMEALLGKPYGTSTTSGQPTWYYAELVYEPETGNFDTLTYIHFANGKVERVGE